MPKKEKIKSEKKTEKEIGIAQEVLKGFGLSGLIKAVGKVIWA